jgi:seryl-tRNA synthetase
MLDLKFIREHTDIVREGIARKNEKDRLDELLALDIRRRELITDVEALKNTRNTVSAQIGALKKEGKDAESLIVEMKGVADTIRMRDEELRNIQEQIGGILLWIPNMPHESVPIGSDASKNVVVRDWKPDDSVIGFTPHDQLDFKLLDHVELGTKLGILDFERGAKVSGSGFPLYVGKGAALERALVNYMLTLHTTRHGYEEVFPPFLVNRESMTGTGQLPKLADDMYRCDPDDVFPIPTAEVPITNMHRDEMLPVGRLPLAYTGYSACFRREAGSYGKETKGFLRVHQFNKVEMVRFTKPDESYEQLELLVGHAEAVLRKLQIPYRVQLLCSGDLSFAAAKCYDIDVWAPAEQKWLEASSCSNFGDFQARRMNIRFKRDAKARPEFVHTLNGSGLATSRLMVALLENYQTPEGKVIVPKVLHPYTGFELIG